MSLGSTGLIAISNEGGQMIHDTVVEQVQRKSEN